MRAACLSDWRGGWVDEGAPAPYAATAAAVRKEIIPTQADSQRQMCGAPRHRSWRWRWRSSDARCPFATPTREQLCTRLAGKRIVLYGDSLTHQFFASLASLAGNATRAPVPRECWRLRHLKCVSVCGGTALVCNRHHFALALDVTPPPLPPNCSVRARVAPLNATFAPRCLASFDLVVLSTFSHWVGMDGALNVQTCLCEGGAAMTSGAAARAAVEYTAALYDAQMRRDAAFLSRLPSASRRVLFRTSPPGYPPPDALRPDTRGGRPPVYLAPSRDLAWVDAYARRESSPFNHHLFRRFNAIARAAYAAHGLPVMDVERPMLHRVDGHMDPLHYCLPGPPDFYSYVLWNFALGQ